MTGRGSKAKHGLWPCLSSAITPSCHYPVITTMRYAIRDAVPVYAIVQTGLKAMFYCRRGNIQGLALPIGIGQGAVRIE